jgi:hypothetical protein
MLGAIPTKETTMYSARPRRFSRSASSATLGRSSASAMEIRSVSSVLALSAMTIRQRSGSVALR